MARFDRSIAVALKLIAKNGQTVDWTQRAGTIPDPTKPWLATSDVATVFQPKICFLPLDKEGKEFLASIGETEALSGSFYGLMGQVAFTPNPKDTVTRDGVALEINSIDLLSPNGQKVLYTIIFNG